MNYIYKDIDQEFNFLGENHSKNLSKVPINKSNDNNLCLIKDIITNTKIDDNYFTKFLT